MVPRLLLERGLHLVAQAYYCDTAQVCFTCLCIVFKQTETVLIWILRSRQLIDTVQKVQFVACCWYRFSTYFSGDVSRRCLLCRLAPDKPCFLHRDCQEPGSGVDIFDAAITNGNQFSWQTEHCTKPGWTLLQCFVPLTLTRITTI